MRKLYYAFHIIDDDITHQRDVHSSDINIFNVRSTTNIE